MEREDEGDIEEEGGEQKREQMSSSAAPGPVPGKEPTNSPEMERTEYRDGAAPKATEQVKEPVKSTAGRCDDPPPPSNEGKEADQDEKVKKVGLRVSIPGDGGGAHGDRNDDNDEDPCDDDMPSINEESSDKAARPAGKTIQRHFYESREDEEKNAK